MGVRFQDLSIRRKVTLSVLLVFGVTLALAATGIAIVSATTFRERAAMQLNALAELIAVSVDAAVLFNEPNEAVVILDRLRRQQSEIVEAHLLESGPGGLRVFASSPRGITPPEFGSPLVRGVRSAPEGTWLVKDLQDDKGNTFAILAVRSNLVALREEQRRSLMVLLAAAIMMLVLSVWLARVLRRAITEPIARLAETAHTIARGNDLTTRIRAPKLARDEVGSLADDFNTMLDALEDQAAALREKEEQYRLLVENSSELVCEVRADGTFVYANHNYQTILGFDDAALMATHALAMVHPDDLASVSVEFARPEAQVVFRHRHADGSWRWLESAGRRYRTSKGEERGVIISRDITGRKRSEEAHERLQAQLAQSQKMESIGRLAGGVAHDFNNMLSVILGHTELSEEMVGADDPLRASLEQIRQAAERSAELTRQLLGFARLQTIAPRVLDLNATVEGMLKMLGRLIGEDVDLVWLPCAGAPGVKIDPSQVDQILANLCVNARHAITDVGRVTIETGVVTLDDDFRHAHPDARPGNYVTLVVSDTGCGMDSAVLAHVFEPFFTTKPLGEGTGLGLATVYGVVQQNGGFIDVESDVGHGTTFTIHLPRHDVSAAPDTTVEARTPVRGTGTVLLVEDEPALLTLATHMLETLGYRVLAAATPHAALALAAAHDTIDVLITDVIMPEMNGRELADAVAVCHPGIGQLFMSGYPAEAIANRGVLESGVHFIQKPFSKARLAATVQAALGRDAAGADAANGPMLAATEIDG